MSKTPMHLGLLVVLLVGTACYHATVETGATPSPTVVKKGFASGWIYGLVPPSTVSTVSQCPNGVARVETKLSFVNMLVSFLTFGIYTPMQIVATCADSGSASAAQPTDADFVDFDAASQGGVEEALAIAITRSREERRPIYIRAN